MGWSRKKRYHMGWDEKTDAVKWCLKKKMVQWEETVFFNFRAIFFYYRRRLPNIDCWLSDDEGGGIQFASLISASSRLLAAIVENFARVSGVILFIVENARAACSSAGFLYGRFHFDFSMSLPSFVTVSIICHRIWPFHPGIYVE